MRLTKVDYQYLRYLLAPSLRDYMEHEALGHLTAREVEHLNYLKGLRDRLKIAEEAEP